MLKVFSRLFQLLLTFFAMLLLLALHHHDLNRAVQAGDPPRNCCEGDLQADARHDRRIQKAGAVNEKLLARTGFAGAPATTAGTLPVGDPAPGAPAVAAGMRG